MYVCHLDISPCLGLNIGTSFYSGVYDDINTQNLSMLGFDLFWKKGPGEILAEWASISLDQTSTEPAAMNGYYIEGRYHFFPQFLKNTFLADGLDNPVFTIFARAGAVDMDTSTTGTNDRKQYTFGFNYRPIETVVFKAEYEINDTETISDNDNVFIASIAVGF